MCTLQRSVAFFAVAALCGLSACGNDQQSAKQTPVRTVQSSAPESEPDVKPAPQAEAPEKRSGGKRVLMVIAPENFRDEELFDTRKAIEEAGHTAVLASTKTDAAKGMLGGEATPDMLIGQAKVADYDAVVFIGGSGTKALLDDEDAFALARRATDEGKLLAAICMAPEILANAGLLKGKRATSWSGGKKNLQAKGATVLDDPVVEDGLIITGNGPAAAKAFGQAIVKRLAGD